jgi:SAM-dependent methyltransferase
MRANLNTYRDICDKNEKGEVRTPKELAEEMLNKLDQSVFKSSTTTFLDPCCGRGNFIIDICERLLAAGCSKESISKRVYAADINPKFCNILKHRLAKRDLYITIIQGDSLKYNWSMKFNVVVGNLPFQKENTTKSTRTSKLYVKFIEFAVNYSDKLLFITPNNWLTNKASKVHKITEDKFIDLIDCSSSFNIAIDTCYFLYDRSANVMDLNITYPEPNMGGMWSRSNIYNNDKRIFANGLIKMASTTGRKDQPVSLVNVDIEDNVFPSFNKWKVICNNVGGKKDIGTIKILPPGVGTSYSIIAFGVNTEREAIELKEYLESTYVREIIAKHKKTTPNSKTIFSFVPKIGQT